MNKSKLKPRSVNLDQCRVLTGNKSCSVTCDGQEEVILIPLDTLNEILKDKKMDALIVGNIVSNHLSEIKDAWQIKKLFGDFGLTGRAYEKTIRNVKYIVFKGKPGMRRVFTGTKYGVGNSKVLSFGIGKAGYARSIKGGTIISLIFVNTWNIAEYFIKNDKSLSDLGITMVSDSVKVVLASAVGGIVGGIALAAGAPVLVPLAAGFVVSVLVGYLLDKADEKWKITESFGAWAHDVLNDSHPTLNSAKNFIGEMSQGVRKAADALSRNLDDELKEWKDWFEKFSFGH